jgi:drug/metabolite transporter (DMT)-like permease
MWALYALTAALLTSFLLIVNKRILTTADVAIVAWIPNALSLPMLLAVTPALIGWSSVDGLFLLGSLASGILNLVATLTSTRALQLADASVTTPFLSFNPAFTLLLSVFILQEVPSVRGIVGVMRIVVGAPLSGEGGRQRHTGATPGACLSAWHSAGHWCELRMGTHADL